MKFFLIIIITLLAVCSLLNLSIAQELTTSNVDLVWIPSVKFFNSDTIAFILDQLMIPEDNPTQIEIIDVNQNGFGNKDVLRVFYQSVDTLKLSDVYFVEDISESLRNLLRKHAPKVHRIDAANLDQMTYESFQDPYYAILGALNEGLKRNYQDNKPIKISYQRNSESVKIEFWDFDKNAMHYKPLPAKGSSDILFITIEQSDTLFIAK